MMADVPHAMEEVTPDWLTRVLSRDIPGLVVQGMEVVGFIHGASTKARVKLRTNRNDAPVSLIVKAGFEPHSHLMRAMHDNEIHAYRDLIPTLEVNAPRCFFADRDAAGHSVVLLEDLDQREARFLSLLEPIAFDLAARFLEALARVHARWWGAERLRDDRFAWTPDTSEAEFPHYFAILGDPEQFAAFEALPRCAAMPRQLLDPARVRRAHFAMSHWHRGEPMVVNHGDMHLGNLYTDTDGTPGLLDWQPRIGPWSLDVSYFIIGGLDLADRRRWEGALLQHYLLALRAQGVDAPSFEQGWDAYRRDVPWGLLIWMLNSTQFQAEARNTAAATRFAMAMIDHDVFNLLGV